MKDFIQKMNIKDQKGYKQTEFGIIPEDWEIKSLSDISKVVDSMHQTPKFEVDGFAMVRVADIKTGNLELKDAFKVSEKTYKEYIKNHKPEKNNIVMSRVGSYGVSSFVETNEPFCMGQNTVVIIPFINNKYLYFKLNSKEVRQQIEDGSYGSGYKSLSLKNINELLLSVAPSDQEQSAIATTLSAIDSLKTSLQKLINKKKLIKQGAMQELLTGKIRLPGFYGEWKTVVLDGVADCFDNLRIPLNDEQRSKMKGEIPYCGANGIVDYINEYKIDDDIILIAEDGGYFDQYKYRPIAYRMKGKSWVNNHAHILKAKTKFDQGFLFYSLVNKNILDFITSGTRAKLNKSEMYKIPLQIPTDINEARKISELLIDMDEEIEKLESKLSKIKSLKQGAMQQLLTGKIRLL